MPDIPFDRDVIGLAASITHWFPGNFPIVLIREIAGMRLFEVRCVLSCPQLFRYLFPVCSRSRSCFSQVGWKHSVQRFCECSPPRAQVGALPSCLGCIHIRFWSGDAVFRCRVTGIDADSDETVRLFTVGVIHALDAPPLCPDDDGMSSVLTQTKRMRWGVRISRAGPNVYGLCSEDSVWMGVETLTSGTGTGTGQTRTGRCGFCKRRERDQRHSLRHDHFVDFIHPARAPIRSLSLPWKRLTTTQTQRQRRRRRRGRRDSAGGVFVAPPNEGGAAEVARVRFRRGSSRQSRSRSGSGCDSLRFHFEVPERDGFPIVGAVIGVVCNVQSNTLHFYLKDRPLLITKRKEEFSSPKGSVERPNAYSALNKSTNQ